MEKLNESTVNELYPNFIGRLMVFRVAGGSGNKQLRRESLPEIIRVATSINEVVQNDPSQMPVLEGLVKHYSELHTLDARTSWTLLQRLRRNASEEITLRRLAGIQRASGRRAPDGFPR